VTTPTTEMRMRYLATERGGQLRIDGPAAYSIVHAHNGAVPVGPSASLATVQAYLAPVDKTIVGAA
jgi:hypothetical protein